MIQNPVFKNQTEPVNPGKRMKGTVKWFDEKKGYGFILCPEAMGEVFIHHTQIKTKGFRTLEQGEEVEFDLVKEDRGLRAWNLTRTRQASRS